MLWWLLALPARDAVRAPLAVLAWRCWSYVGSWRLFRAGKVLFRVLARVLFGVLREVVAGSQAAVMMLLQSPMLSRVYAGGIVQERNGKKGKRTTSLLLCSSFVAEFPSKPAIAKTRLALFSRGSLLYFQGAESTSQGFWHSMFSVI